MILKLTLFYFSLEKYVTGRMWNMDNTEDDFAFDSWMRISSGITKDEDSFQSFQTHGIKVIKIKNMERYVKVIIFQ